MKKLVLNTLLLLAVSSGSVYAQILNEGFENWGNRSNTIGIPPALPNETFNYDDPLNWSSGNQATKHSMLGNGAFVTKDTSTKHTGTSSIRMESNQISVLGFTVTIPGLVVSGEFTINPLDFATGDIDPFAVPGVGFPITGKPSKLVGYYKYAPAGLDTCEIACALVDSARNQVAYGIFKNATTVGSFTRFEVSLVYTSCNRPDTLCIIAASSPFTSGAGSAGVDGSTLWIDSLGISFTPTPNVLPYANNDTVVVNWNTTTNIATLLTNDGDCDGGTLSVSSATTPMHGTASAAGTSVSYTPTTGYVGPDIFTYRISDGAGGTDSAFVVVTVRNNTGINNADFSNFKLFPNPTTSTILVEGIQGIAYQICDLNGRILKTGTIENSTQEIDVTSFSIGTYIFKAAEINKSFTIIR